eukprot:CAMPEP_0185723236 /NCGR_PEP_ID=MMETSP1171-20130828/146_1 /TAXON_ID=374046 /ORGANISM="Helicotheca tamensis, Strain CCMP826" /LENGTH=172 /DNA_ID=CAMNT_0028390905 /DNA_START=235 /DNA_END=753 /DNA_ORIENTATION=+
MMMSTEKAGVYTPPPPPPPPPPQLKPLPLPVILAGGLFLFRSSVKPQYKKFADDLLQLAQNALRSDATVTMELGQGIESGGVFASSAARKTQYMGRNIDQLVLQFQINGGNAWAQGIAYGIQDNCDEQEKKCYLVSLEVSNMDAVLSGQSYLVSVPPLELSEPTIISQEENE